jgi:hypothetical protein
MVFKKTGNWLKNNIGLSKLIESKIVLYLLVLIAIVNIYSYAMEDEPVYAGIMVIVGYLSTFFNKNMIVIIFTSIAITNLVRFGMEQYNKEGFTGDLSQLDNLMSHMTNDHDITKPSGSPQVETDEPVPGEIDYDKNATLNKDPTKRDVEIDKFLKKLNPAGLLKKMEVGVDKKNAELAKDKINLALKYTDQIANEDQRKGVEKLLSIQLKMLDHLLTISPLVDEFRDVVQILKL